MSVDRSYFVAYIMKCKGDINILEEEMQRKKIDYEKHIDFENELDLDEENMILQMDMNLTKNFSKKRVEIVCKAEQEKWKNQINNSSNSKFENLKNKNLIIAAVVLIIGIVITKIVLSK
ncbi:MAG: hypothetical protein ACRCZO_20400 [Cetobacterium sp.]|uniref:hypothetical protein n=1 Tax=Cetobacterium sp. TaxID=2071632 RepID=UPI003F415B40